MIFALDTAIVRFYSDWCNNFAIGSVVDNVEPFIVHVDEYKSYFFSWDSLSDFLK